MIICSVATVTWLQSWTKLFSNKLSRDCRQKNRVEKLWQILLTFEISKEDKYEYPLFLVSDFIFFDAKQNSVD